MRGCHVVGSTVQCDNLPLDLPFFCSVALIRPSMPPLGAALSIVGKDKGGNGWRMEFLDFKRVELGLLVILFRKIRFQVWDVLDLESLSYWPVCELCIWYVLTTDLLKRMKKNGPRCEQGWRFSSGHAEPLPWTTLFVDPSDPLSFGVREPLIQKKT